MNKIIHVLLGRREMALKIGRAEDGRPALVTVHPQETGAEARRLHSAEQQGATTGPRQVESPTIDLPLDLRVQTILQRRLPPEETS